MPFDRLANRYNRLVKLVIYNFAAKFLIILGIITIVHAGPLDTQMKKSRVISGCSIFGFVTFLNGIVFIFARILLQKYVIVGEFFIISPVLQNSATTLELYRLPF